MLITQKGRKIKETLVNEKFPERSNLGKRIARSPSYSTTRLDQIITPTVEEATTTSDNDHLDIPGEQTTRRHSWSSTTSDFSRFGNITLSVTDFSYSRCSSVSNVHDLLEEVFSDDENNEQCNTNEQCNGATQETIILQPASPPLPQKNYLASPESPQLYHNRHLFGVLGGPRRSSWTAGDRNDRNDQMQMFRQSSLCCSARGSMTGSMELPAISEPSSGESTSSEDDGDENEGMEHRVKIEVEKLLRFNNRRGTLGCDGDVKKLSDMMTVNVIE